MFAYVTALSVHGNIQAPCVTTHVTKHEECSRSVTRAFRLCTCNLVRMGLCEAGSPSVNTEDI